MKPKFHVKGKFLRTLLVVGGLLFLMLAIFISPALVRLYYIGYHLSDYKPDQFMVEYYSDGTQGISFGGYVVSSNERYASDSPTLVGTLNKVRELNKVNPIAGRTTPILYIPLTKERWIGTDFFRSYRILRPDEVELPSLTKWTIFVGSLWLIGLAAFAIGARSTLYCQNNSGL